MIERIFPSAADKEHLRKAGIHPESIEDDFFDYSGVLVQKPWGHEYLFFKNDAVAIWMLFIQPQAQTSMHCHPNKQTSVTVLSGEAECSTLERSLYMSAGKGLLLEKGVFHSTKALSPKGIYVLETETPTNKKDLVRLRDSYGREGKGYEGKESFTSSNEHSLTLPILADSPHIQMGDCSISKKIYAHTDALSKDAPNMQNASVTILAGEIAHTKKEYSMKPGDVVWGGDLQNIKEYHIPKEIELLLISKTH
ncbi:MAG: hypothetical protein COU47_00800 [Candidatus Niyogibacteria bacterium CG10_big_fil_rev_8_21_14_0_10_46_36]|uniref:Cupin 2 conserved barrel domain-containing protein n=1 Tax=Candidatus Niyogibacteria bacterium CG10_big_fil_rev_8_21_14_0_10_46_36 TaxID=1974726 RepID=A0A2H0TEI4_9BACT|nr:MAG: hypothetical protein COU47_00800 [Candidatus Niyogibacteria bacterium CG10_big_fil_rev_8_21_14_0_10_46_36]